jgi:5-amino-6-(5-phospho-D-ribitylamino)uracil phosphatase
MVTTGKMGPGPAKRGPRPWGNGSRIFLAIMASARYRILALDVDGTLLDLDGTLRPRTAEAVARAAQAGIQPVLCTGRRYRRARPIAELLGLDAPLVCNSGAIVKIPGDHRTLWRADFDPELVADVLDLFHSHDQPAVLFTDRGPNDFDFIVPAFPTGRAAFDDYVGKNVEHAEIDTAWRRRIATRDGLPPTTGGDEPLFHVCAVGSRAEMLAFEKAILDRIGGRVQTFVLRTSRYLGTMCEIVRVDASKWTAVLNLAEMWGIEPGEICAVGDDANDIPMIRNAGLGVAMGHAHPDVQSVADHVTGGHDEDGVAMLVNEVLLG